MAKADNLIEYKEKVLDNYAKFLYEIKINKYKISYNYARVVLENAFKYMALDVNSFENLDSLFSFLVEKGILDKYKGGVDNLSTWKFYLFSVDFKKKNKKFIFLKNYSHEDFKDFLQPLNESSHNGVSDINEQTNNFLKTFTIEFFKVVFPKNDWNQKVAKEIDVLVYNTKMAFDSELKPETRQPETRQPESKQETRQQNKVESTILTDDNISQGQNGIKQKTNKNIFSFLIGLIILSIGFIAYLLYNYSNNPKTSGPNFPDSTGAPFDTTKPLPGPRGGSHPDTQNTVGGKLPYDINSPPLDNGKSETGSSSNVKQDVIASYIVNDDIKNINGITEMAVMIINDDNSINSGISQKVASVFLKNAGYSNTTSLLSRQFVTDGLFGRIFSGGGIDKSKYNFSEYTDYICLGKINMETEQSEMRNDMIKVSINLELMVVNATNGGEYAHLTVPVAYSTGAGFSKQQAIEVATENIVKYLKTYKHEN